MGGEISAEIIVPFLFIVTLGAVIAFAMLSRKRTKERMNDDTMPKSALADDAPNKRSKE